MRTHRPGTATVPMRRTHRHSIAIAPGRHDFGQRMCGDTMRDMHDAECRCPCAASFAPAPYERVSARGRIARADSPSSIDGGFETNGRFKRRAGYSGTAVNSMTRSGRRPWPGQYALPCIR
ncbi:hypothetical protein WT24_07245 [Burkholderia sp. MSMB1078WGS]|nr:hypothetical protein WT24_07245 [Burkholderia sp. MSMB1078WGS]